MKILLFKFYYKNRVEAASLQLKADARHKVEAAFPFPQSETLEDLRASKCSVSPFLGSAPPTELFVNFTPTFSSSVISEGHPFRAVHLSFIVSLQTTSVLSESQFLANASLYPRSSCRTGQVNKLATKLINSYAKTGDIASARLVFDTICRPDAFLNDVIMKGFVSNGCFEDAILLCDRMLVSQFEHGSFTFPSVLKACGGLHDVDKGRKVHGRIIKGGFEADCASQTALIHMYSQCGFADGAYQVFVRMFQRDAISWGAMLLGYAHNGLC